MFMEVQKINIKVTRYKAEFPFLIDFANKRVKVIQKFFKIGRGMSAYSKTEFFVFLGIFSFGYSTSLWKNNFLLIFTIFAFLSDFKIPALANGVVTMATRKAFFNFSVVYDVLFWQPSCRTGRIWREILYVVLSKGFSRVNTIVGSIYRSYLFLSNPW